MIVLDANILIRAVLSNVSASSWISTRSREIRFYAPETAYGEAEEYLPALLRKKGKSDTDLAAALRYLKSKVEPVERESYGIFEAEANSLISVKDRAARMCTG